MHDTRDIYPGDRVCRMGPPVMTMGMVQYETYTVESFNPRRVDGLKLHGIPGDWNSANFMVVDRPK